MVQNIEIRLKDNQGFTTGFLKEFLRNGLGSMTKRDIDILVMHLLLKDGCFEDEPDYYQLSRKFKISETRVRNLHHEVQLRYTQYSEKDAKEKFVSLIEKRRIQIEGDKVVFDIRDPLLREYFEDWTNQVRGFPKTSFNKNIVKIPAKVLADVFSLLVGDTISLKKLKARLPKGADKEIKGEKTKKAFFNKFIEIFIKDISEESANTVVEEIVSFLKFGFGLLAL